MKAYSVKNYYTLTPEELDQAIAKIRNWLFDFPKHPQCEKALFALEVALCAKELDKEFIDNLLVLC
jgi:hypothetical protein